MNKILALLERLHRAAPPPLKRHHAVMIYEGVPSAMIHIGERWANVPLDLEAVESLPTAHYAGVLIEQATVVIETT